MDDQNVSQCLSKGRRRGFSVHIRNVSDVHIICCCPESTWIWLPAENIYTEEQVHNLPRTVYVFPAAVSAVDCADCPSNHPMIYSYRMYRTCFKQLGNVSSFVKMLPVAMCCHVKPSQVSKTCPRKPSFGQCFIFCASTKFNRACHQ